MTTRLRFAVTVPPRRGLLNLGTLLAWSRAAASRAKQRRQLAEMSDHQLRDIGISRVDALAEAEKSWWRCALLR